MRLVIQKISTVFILALILVAGVNLVSLAEIADLAESRQVGRNWLTYITSQDGNWGGSTDPQLDQPIDIIVNDTVLGRYYEVEPAGYIIVPIIKELPPVKACSDEDRLDFSDPEGFSALIKDVLQNRVRMYVEFYGSLEAVQPEKGDVLLGREHYLEWERFLQSDEDFLNDITSAKESMEEMGPLLTTRWHQGYPYNILCPYGDGGQCVVGCVATAAAQILAYHQWPPQGTGSHVYYWSGDNSCEGSSPGDYLSADYSDSYDWANIVDDCVGGCSQEELDALSELCYEVGVAFDMYYGACGSGAYTADAVDVFPDYFRYKETTVKHDRIGQSLLTWSGIIQAEIAASRPMQYRINSHSIVADGWRNPSSTHQVHMNYGWGGSNNSWYTIDNLYCPWSGCDPMVEFLISNIIPDRGVSFESDTLWGNVPLDIQFIGSSELTVQDWIWDFGNGDSSFEQSPKYTYTTPGQFDVTLQVIAGEGIRSYTATNYITALADSMIAPAVEGDAGSQVEVVITSNNTVPIRQIVVPLSYAGDLELNIDSFSTAGCRTDYFDHKINSIYDPYNKHLVYNLYNTESTTPELEPGSGPIIKLYFTIPASANADQSALLDISGFASYNPLFVGSIISYNPSSIAGSVDLPYMCGDVNEDELVNLFDITYLITFLYQSGPPPTPMVAADVNNSGDCNIFDVTDLISHLYRGGGPLQCP